jgi:16S rRNA (cytosine967-C5)-methyltransferase
VGGQLPKVCNGVLRNVLRNRNQIKFPSLEQPVEYLSVYYSHPEWIVEKYLSEFGFKETENILKYNNSPTGLTLRCNNLKGSREELVELLHREKVECTSDNNIPWAVRVNSLPKGIHETKVFNSGWFYIQDGSSMLVAPILAPEAGELVYDLCSGIGGKCTHLAEFMNNNGQIKAFDIYEQKLQLLKYNCQRLGITIVESLLKDIETLEDNMPRGQRVLLDAPCSGLGVLSRRADLRWHKKPEEIEELTTLQSHLLEKASQLVNKNGRLVYTTCTINFAENQHIVTGFLEKNPAFSLENLNDNLNFLPLDHYDRSQAATGMLTLLPGKYLTDGMFYASMRRN